MIEAFLASDEELDVMAPEANAYEFQSHSVIDMLEKLSDKFVDERSQLEKAELSQRHAYDMLQADLTDSIKNAEDAISTKSQVRSQDLQLVATRQGDLQDAMSTNADDSKYLTDLTSTCSQKTTDFKTRQSLRADELVAIEKAIEILSSDDVMVAASKHLPSMLQAPIKAAALVQFRSVHSKSPTNQIRMAAYLNG